METREISSPAHEVVVGDIVITMSARTAVRPCFSPYLGNHCIYGVYYYNNDERQAMSVHRQYKYFNLTLRGSTDSDG